MPVALVHVPFLKKAIYICTICWKYVFVIWLVVLFVEEVVLVVWSIGPLIRGPCLVKPVSQLQYSSNE